MPRMTRVLPALLALAASSAPAAAQTDYFWNAPGGTGPWDTTTANWRTAGDDPYTWTSSGQERANFGGTAGTVTIATGGVTAYGLNFTASGYTVGGATLTLAGAGGPISVSTGTATISSVIAGSVGLTKTGAGTLALGGANSYSGGTVIEGGTVRFVIPSSGSPFGSGAVTLNPAGGDVRLLASTASGTVLISNAITVSAGSGTAVLGSEYPDGTNGDLRLSGNITLNGPATFQVARSTAATSRVRLSGVISGTGDITIQSQNPALAAGPSGPKVVFDRAGTGTANSFGNVTIGPNVGFQLGNGTNSGNVMIPDSSDIRFNTGSLFIIARGGAGSGADEETVGALVSLSAGAGTITTITPGADNPVYTLTVGGGNKSGVFSGVVGQGTGTGNAVVAIAKTGTGTQVFSGNNTYSAGTTINGGTLLVNGQTGTNSGTGTGTVTVNNTGILGGTGRAAGAVTVNGGGRVLAGDGTAADQTLTLGNNLTVANNGGIRIVAGNGASFNDFNAASLVSVAGVFNRAAASNNLIHIEIALDGSGFDIHSGTTYTRRVLTYGSLGANLTAGTSYTIGDNVFSVTGIGEFDIAPGWQVLVGLDPDLNPVNAVYVQFTPVPEPGVVLAAAAAGLGLGGLARRVRRRVAAGAVS
jgi:fibronectin-binding autotransporter adhesin